MDENDPTVQMQEILRSMGQADIPTIKPILEINPKHELVEKLKSDTNSFDDIALLLYEQALLQEGIKLEDTAGFVKRMNRLISTK
jgi:molecular chaperone HtpG